MTTEEPNRSARPWKILVPQDHETLCKPLPQGPQQYWSTPMQVYHSVSTPTPSFNSYAAGPYFYPHMLANQAYSPPLQYDSLHDLRKLTNHPVVATDFPPNEKQQSDTMLANGKVAQKKMDSIQNHNTVHGSKSSALQDLAVNSTKVNLDSGTGLNASGNILVRVKQEEVEFEKGEEEIKIQRKRQSSSLLARRTRMHKKDLSVNSTEGTNLNASGTNLLGVKQEEEEIETEKQEDEIRKKRIRQSNRLSARRTRVRKQQECDDLHEYMLRLKLECTSLTGEIMSISEQCHQLSEENNSLQEELILLFGKESIADLLATKNPA